MAAGEKERKMTESKQRDCGDWREKRKNMDVVQMR